MSSYQNASDEELILLARSGDQLAQDQLDYRYFHNLNQFCRFAAPDLIRYSSSLDLYAIAYRTYLNCLYFYTFGTCKFKSYFDLCLRHAFSRAREQIYEEKRIVFSLDECTKTTPDVTYHDVIPTGSINDNPCKYVDYFEEIYLLRLAPKVISPEVLLVARERLEGASFKEIASKLNISLKCAYYRYSLYEGEVKKLLRRLEPKDTRSKRK